MGGVSKEVDNEKALKTQKVLSIIIPTYNMEKYLRHCLDSLIVPNMDKVEVLVVNDGSKDSSSAIAHEYEDKYPQTFRVIDKENGNYGSCINRGLKEMTGKYVKVLDADDSFEKDNFNKYIELLEKLNADLVLTDYHFVDEEDNITKTYSYAKLYNIAPKKLINFSEIVDTTPFLIIRMHGVAFKSTVFDDLQYHQVEGISYTDAQWCLEPMINVKTVYYEPMVVYRYLFGRAGQTMENQAAHILDLMTVVYEMSGFFEQHHLEEHENAHYFINAIEAEIKTIYIMGLYDKAFCMEKLVQFDKMLRSYPFFYKDVEPFSYHHAQIIRLWRKNNYHLPVWFPAFKAMQKTVHPFHEFILKILGKEEQK